MTMAQSSALERWNFALPIGFVMRQALGGWPGSVALAELVLGRLVGCELEDRQRLPVSVFRFPCEVITVAVRWHEQ